MRPVRTKAKAGCLVNKLANGLVRVAVTILKVILALIGLVLLASKAK